MRTADFDFELPEELIAQQPLPRRDASRLLVLERVSGEITHRHFPDLLKYLRAGDVLVLNDSRVIPARLRGTNARTGGEFEILLLEENSINDWWCMLRPGKRGRIGTEIVLRPPKGPVPHACDLPRALVIETNEEGHRRLQFKCEGDIRDKLDLLGEVPLPPYIHRDSASDLATDRERYQTVFARPAGSVAAPTAALHFTQELLDRIRSLGVQVCFVTLHVGLGTFAPVKAEILSHHPMHEERFDIPQETVRAVDDAKKAGRRVIAVGTTTLRVLESIAVSDRITLSRSDASTLSSCSRKSHLTSPIRRHSDRPIQSQSDAPALHAGPGRTRIFIYPPFNFKIADALLTNFHLPRSTLLMLVSAFAAPNETRGRDLMLSAYSEAVTQRYRFFSYGDAMLIL